MLRRGDNRIPRSWPCAISVSIWSIRITELRITMPTSETMPRMATNPIGAPESKQRRGNTDQRQWRGREHKEQTLEALQLHHQDGDHDEQHEREHGEHAGLGLGAVLDRAANNHVVARRQLRLELPQARSPSARTTVAASTPGAVSAWTVTVGRRWLRQISGGSSA